MSVVRVLIVAALVSLTQTSCVMPAAFPKTISAEIPTADTKSIHEGKTSKEDIRIKFGDPDWRSVDDSRWIYEMRQYFPWGWVMCVAYAGQGGCGEIGERPLKIEYLDLRFDPSGTVDKWSTVSARSGDCIDDVACIETNPDKMNAIGSFELGYGPGLDSPELHAAVGAVAYDSPLIISKPANWFEDSYGFDDALSVTANDVAGILAVTEYDLVFFVWSGSHYLPIKTISREELQDVVVESKGKSRCLILVTATEDNTFEVVGYSRRFVDVAGTESVAEILMEPSRW